MAIPDAATALAEIREKIARACERVGRPPEDVTLVGASKTVQVERLRPFYEAGLRDFGENYVQEALGKIQAFENSGLAANWHCIGALQSRKARDVAGKFTLIHSVDRLSLAREIDKAAAKLGKIQEVLLQVNLGGEATKSGVEPADLAELFCACRELPHSRVRGLMSLPPYREIAEETREFHRALRILREELITKNGASPEEFAYLSMGMTHDFEIAIEEGATHVRVGTGLFGGRG